MQNTVRYTFKCLTILFLFLQFLNAEVVYERGFDKKDELWRNYGNGQIKYNEFLGNKKPGCISITNSDSSEQSTVHQTFTELSSGRYEVELFLRAYDVKVGQWNYSAWLFHQAEGTKKAVTVVKDLKGTFNWSSVRFTVDIPEGKSKFTFWIRLKAQGALWVDDVKVNKIDGEKVAYQFKPSEVPFEKPNPRGEGVRCENCYRWMKEDAKVCNICGSAIKKVGSTESVEDDLPQERLLFGFESEQRKQEEKYMYLRDYKEADENYDSTSARVKLGQYVNLVMKDHMSSWEGYDYLCIDIYNPFETLERFTMAIKDNASTGNYWTQQNHNVSIRPGWNKLKLHVKNFVGERGSVRHKRYLNLKKLKSCFFGIALEQGRKSDKRFLADNIRLVKAAPAPKAIEGMYAFDFVKEKFRTQNGFVGIQIANTYDEYIGFGFEKAQIWRAHDSMYADQLHRDGIFINGGSFKVDVPNGKYKVKICATHLGVWSEQFWSHRKIDIEGVTVLEEKKKTVQDHLDHALRFEGIEPGLDDNAYDLYLKKVYAPYEAVVEVSDGSVNIDFKGDNSGLCVNWLIIVPEEKSLELEKYMDQYYALFREDFNTIATDLTPVPDKINEPETMFVAKADIGSKNPPYMVPKEKIESITLNGGINERPMVAFAIRNPIKEEAKVSFSISDLKSGGETIAAGKISLRKAVNQYLSHTFNHETFELAPRYLEDLSDSSCVLKPNWTQVFWLQIPVMNEMKKGVYKGKLTVTGPNLNQVIPITLKVHSYTLPELDVAATFFGMNPLLFLNYVKLDEAKPTMKESMRKALVALQERGFNSFTELPSMSYDPVKDVLDSKDVDDLMSMAKEVGFNKKVFSYGNHHMMGFLQLDNPNGKYKGVSASEYRKKLAKHLDKKVKSGAWLPLVVDISDEASGYSQKVNRDLVRAKIMKEYFPMFRIGGYTHVLEKGKYGYDLNEEFTDGSYSSIDRPFAEVLKKKGYKWGLYNQSIGLFDNNRRPYGEGLYRWKKEGMDHILGWALTFTCNYHYYDLDGRENDALMVLPKRDGGLNMSIKFEWTAQGLEDCRLLMLLENLIKKAGSKADEAAKWLAPYSSKGPLDEKKYNQKLVKSTDSEKLIQFRKELKAHILSLL